MAMVALMLISSCAPASKPLSKEDKQIIAVMMVVGGAIGAGVGAATTTAASSDTAGVAFAGALAGAAAGYVAGDLIVNRMNDQERAIRLSKAAHRGDLEIRRDRPDRLHITMRQGAEFPEGGSELTREGKQALDTVSDAIREHGSNPEISIIAFANDASSSRANARLSRDRAASIADYLHQQGIGSADISHEGRGRPLLLPASKRAQQNPWYRRVELIIQEQAG